MCNLASIAVNMFLNPDKTYNFSKLKEITKVVTKNLNKIVDINHYPVPEVGSLLLVALIDFAFLSLGLRLAYFCGPD